MSRNQTVEHLRQGKIVRFCLERLSFEQGQHMVDGLEQHVGLPLERAEMVEPDGRVLLVWRCGAAAPPVVRLLESVVETAA